MKEMTTIPNSGWSPQAARRRELGVPLQNGTLPPEHLPTRPPQRIASPGVVKTTSADSLAKTAMACCALCLILYMQQTIDGNGLSRTEILDISNL